MKHLNLAVVLLLSVFIVSCEDQVESKDQPEEEIVETHAAPPPPPPPAPKTEIEVDLNTPAGDVKVKTEK